MQSVIFILERRWGIIGKFTPKQERFCEEYLVDLNATQAAIRAGYSAKTANEQGSKLLVKVSIQKKIDELRQRQSLRTEITADRVIQELAAIAFSDRTKIAAIRESGKIEFAPTERLSEDVKKTISGIECGKYGIKVSTCDKVKALELLGKHLGIFDKRQSAEEITDDGFIDALAGTAEKDWSDDK